MLPQLVCMQVIIMQKEKKKKKSILQILDTRNYPSAPLSVCLLFNLCVLLCTSHSTLLHWPRLTICKNCLRNLHEIRINWMRYGSLSPSLSHSVSLSFCLYKLLIQLIFCAVFAPLLWLSVKTLTHSFTNSRCIHSIHTPHRLLVRHRFSVSSVAALEQLQDIPQPHAALSSATATSAANGFCH